MLNVYTIFKCNYNFGLKCSSSNQFATQLGSGKFIFKPSLQGKKNQTVKNYWDLSNEDIVWECQWEIMRELVIKRFVLKVLNHFYLFLYTYICVTHKRSYLQGFFPC